MSDDKTLDGEPKGSEKPKEDAPPKEKTWSDDEVQKIISERDTAKKKAREAQAKIEAEEEAKKIAEGKKDEVIESLKAKLKPLEEFYETRSEQEKAARASAMAELPDELKSMAEELSLPNLLKLVNTTKTRQLNQDRGKKVGGETDDLAIRKGESANDYNHRVLRKFPLTQ